VVFSFPATRIGSRHLGYNVWDLKRGNPSVNQNSARGIVRAKYDREYGLGTALIAVPYPAS